MRYDHVVLDWKWIEYSNIELVENPLKVQTTLAYIRLLPVWSPQQTPSRYAITIVAYIVLGKYSGQSMNMDLVRVGFVVCKRQSVRINGDSVTISWISNRFTLKLLPLCLPCTLCSLMLLYCVWSIKYRTLTRGSLRILTVYSILTHL